MRRAIVHIGMPRTGTTSLQSVLAAHRPELARAGVFYPDLRPRSASHPHLSHQYLGEALDGRRPRHELRELLAGLDAALAATPAELAILSYEGLSQLSSWHAAPWTLRELFARHGFQMEVAVTLKTQDLYAQSWYTWRCQFLREPRYFAEALPSILRDRRFNYMACVRPWAIAAAGRVLAIPVHDRRSDAPLLERVLAELGLAERLGALIPDAELRRMDNRSMSAAAIEIARRVRERFGAQRGLARARAITEFIAAEAALRGFDTAGFRALDAATSEQILARFAAGNDRLARSLWGENWSRRVAAVPLAPANAYRPDSPPDQAAAQLEAIALQAGRRFALQSVPGRMLEALRSVASRAPMASG